MASHHCFRHGTDWEINGAYASWKMSVTAGPPDHELHEYRDEWRREPLERPHLHFVDVVNLLELGRQLSNSPRYHHSGT
jgi:hypothetical protein